MPIALLQTYCYDSLTSAELTNYQRLEDMAIAMINLNMRYSEIKELIFKV
ncbi:prophage ps3 protein 13 [Streptococcus pneumoniae]|nr:prophage ps3 protein 13 [Streptococcus pneumoniae]